LVDELRDPVTPVQVAPDEMGLLTRIEALAMPIRLETLRDLVHLVSVRRHHRVVARLREVPGLPIERLHERRLVVNQHRLLVRDVKSGIAVEHGDARPRELFVSLLVLMLSAPARRIEHHPYVDAPLVRGDHGREQRGIREHEHLDAQRLLRGSNGAEDRFGGVVGQNDQ
jgi:hypothetical protein